MRGIDRRLLVLAMALGLAVAPFGHGLAAAGVPSPAPVAADDGYTVDEDAQLQVDPPGILANDSPGATTCVAGVDAAELVGELDWEPSGAFVYSPPADFNGQTSFTYGIQAEGGPDCPGPPDSQATVTLTVNPVNDAPTARADSFGALRDRTLNVAGPGVLLNDGDVDGDSLVAVKESNPAHGVVNLAPDGAFSYTPNAGYLGPDGFSYRASDGTATSPVRVVSITVTAIPTPIPTTVATPAPPVQPTPTAEASQTASSEPSASADPFATASALPSISASASPGASIAPQPVDDEGGLSIPGLVVGLLLLSILAFGGAVYLPKWLEARRAGSPLDDA